MRTAEEVGAVLHNKKVMLSQNIAARDRVHTEGSETLLNAEIRLLEWVLAGEAKAPAEGEADYGNIVITDYANGVFSVQINGQDVPGVFNADVNLARGNLRPVLTLKLSFDPNKFKMQREVPYDGR